MSLLTGDLRKFRPDASALSDYGKTFGLYLRVSQTAPPELENICAPHVTFAGNCAYEEPANISPAQPAKSFGIR